MIDEPIIPISRTVLGELTVQPPECDVLYSDIAELEIPDYSPRDSELAFLFAGVSESVQETQIGIKGNYRGTETISTSGEWSDDGGFCTPWINIGQPSTDDGGLIIKVHTTERVQFEKVAVAIGVVD